MILKRGTLWVQVDNASDAEQDWLDAFLAFKTEGFVRSGGHTKHVERNLRLYDGPRARFPSGLRQLVEREAGAKGFVVTNADCRQPGPPIDPAADLSWLRDYQRKAVDIALAHEQGIVWISTGGGKTELLPALARAVPTARWLFVCHRAQLVEQAAERMALRIGEQAGIVGDGQWTEARITCATFQTLHRALTLGNEAERQRCRTLLASVDGLIGDECHAVASETYWRVAMLCPARWRLGLSGTPLARGDKRSVMVVAAMGPVIYRLKPEVLIQAGVLARPEIKMVSCAQAGVKAKTWAGVYSEAVVKSTARNALVQRMASSAEKPALVFVQHLKHGKEVLARLQKAGLNSEFIAGDAPLAKRQHMVSRLEGGDLDVLITTVIFQEGIDIPNLRSVVIASGGASVIAALQRIGRGMRVVAGKTTMQVWDIDDRGHRWLEKHARNRQRAYLREGHAVLVGSDVFGPFLPAKGAK